ncbi:MAG: ROK family protein [Treponema sp.]|jgi:hypothetical protein|nr:ROK family protein [Treponema sp.]
MNKTNDQLVRELNLNSIRVVAKQLRRARADEFLRIAGVESGSFEDLAAELCGSGELVKESADGGQFYRFNAAFCLVLAICVLEKNKVYAAVSNLYGEFLEQEEINAAPETMDFFDRIVERYQKKYPAIRMLAFGMAGFEVRGSGPLLSINFPKLEWIHFRDHFKNNHQLDSILENDIKAAVAGFYHTRAFGEGQCVAAIYLARSHHPAAGICINGNIYRGRDNAAGEVIFLETPVRWRHFESNDKIDYTKVDVEKLLGDMALPLIVYLNPDCLVVYGNWLPETTGERLKKRLVESVPREFLPDIVFEKNIVPDFLDGLVHRALVMLEPKLDFNP